MRIVADAAIRYLPECLEGALGGAVELVACPGTHIDASTLRGARALLVRSVTRVDEALVAGSGLGFVGSATAGIDHVDTQALRAHGIAFGHAAGCNANAVVHYVLAALYQLVTRHDPSLAGRPIGVVGYGHVGSRLCARLRAMGWRVLVNDPPLEAAADARESFLALDALLASCGVVSVHVPLTGPDESPWPTRALLDARRVRDALARGTCLIQTSRGGVLDETALLDGTPRGRVVLDVFEGEPALRWDLLEPAAPVHLATPHIAGYSLEGKRLATRLVVEALVRALAPERAGTAPLPPPPPAPAVLEPDPALAPDQAIADVLARSRGILEDDRALRGLMQRSPAERPRAFEALRASYELRREPSAWTVRTSDERVRALSSAAGFSLEP